MGNTLRDQNQALAAARERTLRDAQLVELGTLAASTAHEIASFGAALARAMQRRGFAVELASDVRTALHPAGRTGYRYALVDLRLGSDSGLALVERLARSHPAMRIVVVTGYASIATAVEAIKLGAVQYLTKPADPDDIVRD